MVLRGGLSVIKIIKKNNWFEVHWCVERCGTYCNSGKFDSLDEAEQFVVELHKFIDKGE